VTELSHSPYRKQYFIIFTLKLTLFSVSADEFQIYRTARDGNRALGYLFP